MPTVDQTVADSIRAYSSLYACRTDVLHHLFCVNGNGLEWEKGELVDPYENQLQSLEEQIAKIRNRLEEDSFLEDLKNTPELQDYFKDALNRKTVYSKWEEMQTRFRYENADALAKICWELPGLSTHSWLKTRSIYPLSQYSRMNRVPDNVKSDWLAAVREMILVVFTAPARKPDYQSTEEHCKREQLENIDFADTVLQSLHKRFGSPEGLVTSYKDYMDRMGAGYALYEEQLDGLASAADGEIEENPKLNF